MDNVDFSILRSIKDAGRPLWKKKVHQTISDRLQTLPLQDEVSAQTIGRHIDALENAQYLETTVISSDEVDRVLIIGYGITTAGKRLLEEKRELLLKRIISRELFGNDTFPIEKEALAILIRNEFTAGLSINESTQDYTRRQLLLLLGMYFIEEETVSAFTPDERQRLRNAIQRDPFDH